MATEEGLVFITGKYLNVFVNRADQMRVILVKQKK